MDRRPPYNAVVPPAHPPPPHPPTPVDVRPSLPHFSQPQHQPVVHPQQPPPPPPPPPPSYVGPAHPPAAPGPALPPIQQPYAPPGAPPDSQNLPPFRHPQQPPHELRDGQDYHAYNQRNHSEHATPAPVNRSYSHDSSQQQRTPTTPAHPGSYPPGPTPDGAPPPPLQHMEHGGHHGYPPPTNGVHHGLPQPQGPPPQYEQPPPHHYTTPVIENHHPYGPPPPHSQPMSYTPSYGPASASYASQKRKQMRATQACEQCRQRKQKCDEGNPCSFCKENSLTCQYRDTPPAKTDKNMEKLLSYMESHQQALENLKSELNSKIDNFDQRLSRVEHAPAFQGVGATVSEPSVVEEPPPRKAELDDHRTAPHKLILLWPSVGPLTQDAGVTVSDSYVMEAEDRGILRLYTKGEGIDEHDGTQPGGPASPARSEESGEGNAPSPPEGLWGTGFPPTPNSDIRRSEPYCAGGLKPDGSLDLDLNTINQLYESYMRNFHILHPFLDRGRLRKLFDSFIKRYCPSHPNLKQKFAVPSDNERPLKRQRSNGSTIPTLTAQESTHLRREPTERSPGNAIVWLVLALGKIALHKDPLPSTVPDSRLNTNTVISHHLTNPSVVGSSPISGTVKPSPMSPKSTSTTQPTPPSHDGNMPLPSRSRRSSVDGPMLAGARNLDIIPGLAYYAKAAEILGDQGDGNDLVHAQMFLLAGLYKGQLARVKESMSWIIMAGRAIMMLLDRYKLYNDNYWTAYGDIRKQHEKGQARIKDKRHSLIVLASWTCLQLESDILAELRLPSSGIQTIENMLLMPHNMPDEERESYEGIQQVQHDKDDKEGYENILLFYTAQMFLRKRLNQVHREMYGDQCLNQPLNQVREMLSGHERILSFWRDTLPADLRWNDEDPPASDILHARLRAKYYGARYIVNRPFLDYALHIMPQAKEGRLIEEVAKDVHGNPRDKAEIHLFKAIELMGEQEIWQASKRCIDAAMHSTVALDGVPDRLIMTNIHGTAHAQFGNMLVLSATYYNRWLKTLVPVQEFQKLLERTIQFQRRLSPISPTCSLDCQILEKISKLLFGNVPIEARHTFRNEIEPMSATTSFSNPGS